MKALVLALSLLPLAAAAQTICGIEAPPDDVACKGDPVSLTSGFSYHFATDVDLDTGSGRFQLTRYFMPVGALGGSKSPLLRLLGVPWPTGTPPGPFGVYSPDGGVLSAEPRPTWSHDAYSFVVPTVQGLADGGTGAPLALVFEGGFRWTVFNRTGSPGMQVPFGNNPGTAMRLEALATGYRVIKDDNTQWVYEKLTGATPNAAPVLLTELRDSRGQLVYSVQYPTTGCLNLASSLTFRAGGKLELSYSGSCSLTSIAWRAPGATTTTTVSSYAYWNGGPGRVSRGGSPVDPETYSYPEAPIGFGYSSWNFNIVSGDDGGVPRASHLYPLIGSPVTGYQGYGQTENFTMTDNSIAWFSGTQPQYLACSVQTDTIDQNYNYVTSSPLTYELNRTVATSTHGGGPSVTATKTSTFHTYNDDIFGLGTSKLGEQADSCTGGGTCASGSHRRAVAPLTWNANNICSDGRDGGSPAVPYGTKDRRDNWSIEKKVSQAPSGEQLTVVAARGMSVLPATLPDGGADYLSAGALQYATLNSVPQYAGNVRLNLRRELPSTLAGGNTIFDQRFIDTGTTSNGIPTRFLELAWQQGTTKVGGAVVSQTRGTFYRLARGCLAPSTSDPSNRVLRIEGPCVITDSSALGCSGTAFPVTELRYYDATAANVDDRGRLEKVVRYPNYTTTACGAGLETTYSSYNADGIPLVVTDANLVSTTYTFDGKRMLSRRVGPMGSPTWNFAYEADGSLRSVQNPQLDYEVFCRHGTSSATPCDFAQPLTAQVQWKGKSAAADGTASSERVEYAYFPDGALHTETFKDAAGSTRLVKRHEPDASGRMTWDGTGTATSGSGSVATKRLFDGNDNLVAQGGTYAGAPDFCGLATPSPLCSWMTFDRADRLAQVDLNPSGTSGAQTKTCIDYDNQGNVRRVVPGCAASDSCSINHSNGATSTCASGSAATDYDVDDFGGVVAVRMPSAGETRYEYNALGLVVKKETEAMRAAGTWQEFSYDMLGRLTALKRNGTGGLAQLFALFYDVAIPGRGCPSAATARVLGRLGYQEDSFGLTGYQYDLEGRVTKEVRQRMGYYGLCLSSLLNYPSTSYNYSSNGNLLTITYPLGRVVTYNYGASGGSVNRVASVDITVFPGGGGAPFTESLLTGVTWEPYGGLQGYGYVAGAVANTVQFSRDGDAQTPVADACGPLRTGAPDGTGRVTGIYVSGGVMSKFLTWTGEQLTTEQTCFHNLGQKAEHRQDYSLDKMGRLTGVAGTNMPRKTNDVNDVVWTDPYSRAYGYSARGNRSSATIDGCGRALPLNQDVLSSQKPTCWPSVKGGPIGLNFATDADGRAWRYSGCGSVPEHDVS